MIIITVFIEKVQFFFNFSVNEQFVSLIMCITNKVYKKMGLHLIG